MGTVLRPVYDNNTTLDSFRDAAQLFDGQLLTFYMEKVCLNAVTCILCPLYGRTCDGKPEHPLDVQDIPTTEEEDVLHELRFERDCCSF